MNDVTRSGEKQGMEREERKPLSPEAREQMKRELKAQVRAFADALKKQIREKKEKGVNLEEAMREAEREAEKKMAEETRRDTIDVSGPGAGEKAAAAAEGAGAGAAAPAEGAAGGEGNGESAATAGENGERHESALPKEELERLTNDIIAALKTIYDPEIPVDIYELGLIYRIDISDDYVITIDMTLTAPGCPVAGDMPGWVEKAVGEVEGVREVRVNLTFDPPWDMSRMSDEARLALNMW